MASGMKENKDTDWGGGCPTLDGNIKAVSLRTGHPRISNQRSGEQIIPGYGTACGKALRQVSEIEKPV